ncbi:MAG: hypothetical protein K0U47_06070 [Epsilonproteobacteria bacterium]|nr:hypothetical protein [Campylobacterota bacterium]
MKKIILLFLFSWIFALNLIAGTDIYFGNGVWNDKKGARIGMARLEKIVKKKILENNPELIAKYTPITLSFNWTGTGPGDSLSIETKMQDVIETFYQLKDSGQLDESSLFRVIELYLSKNLINVALLELLDEIYAENTRAINGANLVEMIASYENNTLATGDKVLLVAHSQGNLFGNEVYDNLLSEYQDKFQLVSVGTPANRVLESDKPYTTLTCDIVIGAIPGHLEAKMPCSDNGIADPTGHEFVASYLTNLNSLNEIAENIKKYLELC